jgi:PAS domain-containing protein
VIAATGGTNRTLYKLNKIQEYKGEKTMLNKYFKSIIDADRMPVVICNTQHEIIYMNPTAQKRYAKHGGGQLVGKSIFDCHNAESVRKMKDILAWFEIDKNNNTVYTFTRRSESQDYDVYVIALRDEQGELIGYYEKHEDRLHETMKMYDIY